MKDLKRKRRLEVLLERNKSRNKEKDTSVALEECLIALGSDVIVWSDKKTKEIYQSFEDELKITSYGRIEWDLYAEYEEIDKNTFENRYANEEDSQYLLWNYGSDPVIEAKMSRIVKSFDEVTSVCPDVWIYQKNKRIIEIFHDGIIRVLNKI